MATIFLLHQQQSNFPPLQSRLDCIGSDATWFPRTGQKEPFGFHLGLWECSLLEPSHHPVKKPKQACGMANIERSQDLWMRAAAELPAYSLHWPASHENEASQHGPCSPSWATLTDMHWAEMPCSSGTFPNSWLKKNCEQNKIALSSQKLKAQQ